MRIIQLIDSLQAGGAEKMALNYANELAKKVAFSGLVVTRCEGLLCDEIQENVSYLFLDKKNTIDFSSILKFRRYLITNKIEIIHSHSTSFFFAFLIKLTLPKMKLIWHDHYGDSEFLNKRQSFFLKICIPFFSGIIAVNEKLKVWSQEKLKLKNVIFLRNFTTYSKPNNKYQTVLKGVAFKRIIHVANLREQKNHEFLIDVALKLKKTYPEWTFHLIGKDFNDYYSKKIKNLINKNELKNTIFVYGSCSDIGTILNQTEIAILTSKSEGLPVALLEYGFNRKPVVVTNVGEISSIIVDNINGYLVSSVDTQSFYEKIILLIENKEKRIVFGSSLEATIKENFSEQVILKHYLNWLKILR